jgi:hypothetical protein
VPQPPPVTEEVGKAYSYPWPDALAGLGHRTVGPFDHCERCGAGSWVRFGETVLCLGCASAQVMRVERDDFSKGAAENSGALPA